MTQRMTIHMYDKVRGLYLADYLMVYGAAIEVTQVIVSINGKCVISMIGNEEQIMSIVRQFHEDY